MGSEMVERVARAIEAEVEKKQIYVPFEDMARAAIEAMREPTAAMLDAAERSEHGDDCHYAAPRHVWPIMIDAALDPPLPEFDGTEGDLYGHPIPDGEGS